MEPTSVLSAVSSSVPGPMDMFNQFSSMGQNFINQRWSEKMYKRQYDDSVNFWNMQNAYNSPKAQMARFGEAGLNPNLIYGRGESGNAGSPQMPDVQPVNFRTPSFEGNKELMPSLLGAADLRIKQAQADNLEVQNHVLQQEVLYKMALTKSTMTAEQRQAFDLAFEKGMSDVSADFRRANLNKVVTETEVLTNRDMREAAQNSSNLMEAAERILSMQSQRATSVLERKRIAADTARIWKDGTLKQIEIDLRNQGINPNDPLWARYVGMALSKWLDPSAPTYKAGNLWSWLFD